MNYDSVARRRLLLSVILSALAVSFVNVLLLQPLYIMSITNILFSTTWLPTILAVLIDVFEIAVYLLCYPMIIYAYFRFSCRFGFCTAIGFFCVTAFRYLTGLILSWIQNKAVAGDDLTSVIVYLLFEAAQLLILCFVCNSCMKRFHKQIADLEHSHARLGMPIPSPREHVFPYRSLFSFINPLQNIALKGGILLSATKILTRLIYDIQAGAPRSLADLLWIITYYTTDILIGISFYAIALLLFTLYDKRYQKHVTCESKDV